MNKILHLYKEFYPVRGGIQQAIKTIVELTPEYKHTVLVTNSVLDEETKLYGADVIYCKSFAEIMSTPLSFKYLVKARRLIDEHDIVCVHYPYPLNEFAILGKKIKNLIYFWHSDIISQKIAKKLIYPLVRLGLRKASIVAISYPDMAVNSDILCKFADKTIVCSYFIENRPLSSVPVIDTSKFGRYMLGVGRLVPYKGFEYIIQAMPSIDDLNLVICGNGFLYEKLIALSEELKLTGRINIITDASDEYLAELYAGCEFFVFPSCLPSEAFGIAMLDAMNNGKAILNTCLNTGVNYVARDGLEALTVAPCCVMELVAAVKKLAFDVEFRQELGNNAQQRSNTVFSKENRRVTLLKIFSEVLRSKNV